MSPIDFVMSRRSIRRYEKKDIPSDILEKIIEAGRQAPSAANRQPRRFIILTDYEIKKELSKGLFNRFLKNSPVVIVGCANPKDFLTGKWASIDTAISLQNMVIAAWTLGIGSCWIGDFKEDKVKQLLKVPAKWKVVALVTFGYPAEKPKQRKKKSTKELFSYNKF
jgi:nitroreductase